MHFAFWNIECNPTLQHTAQLIILLNISSKKDLSPIKINAHDENAMCSYSATLVVLPLIVSAIPYRMTLFFLAPNRINVYLAVGFKVTSLTCTQSFHM